MLICSYLILSLISLNSYGRLLSLPYITVWLPVRWHEGSNLRLDKRFSCRYVQWIVFPFWQCWIWLHSSHLNFKNRLRIVCPLMKLLLKDASPLRAAVLIEWHYGKLACFTDTSKYYSVLGQRTRKGRVLWLVNLAGCVEEGRKEKVLPELLP